MEKAQIVNNTQRTKGANRVIDLTAECFLMTVDLEDEEYVEYVPVSRREEILKDPISPRNELIVDSGCSEHMFNTSCLLTSYRKMYQNEKTVTVANGESVPVEGVRRCGKLKVVYFVPLLSHSLLSV